MKTEKKQKQIESMIPTPQQTVEHLDKKLEEAKRLYAAANADQKYVLERLFPQLKESEDERTRKAIVLFFELQDDNTTYSFIPKKDILSWLEKQGTKLSVYQNVLFKIATILSQHEDKEGSPLEQIRSIVVDGSLSAMDLEGQKPADKVEPKFHVGVWITNSIETVQITGYDIDYGYQVDYKGNLQHRDTDIIEKEYHLWTIEDAKDGDVLVASDGSIFLFAGAVDCACKYYVALATDNYVKINKINKGVKGGYWEKSRAVYPATKEQRDKLEKAITEAGYEWDADKKELRKIEQQAAEKLSKEQEYTLNRIVEYLEDNNCPEDWKDLLMGIHDAPYIKQKPAAWSDEDERIRKELLEHCRKQADIYNTLHTAKEYCKVQSWVAWLEKQGEQKPADEEMKTTLRTEYEKGRADVIGEIRKSAWSDEDEQAFIKSVEALEDFGKFELADWLKEHKNHFLRPQNTWKPSDEQMGAQEEPVSEDLEEASKEWLRSQLDKSYAYYGEGKMMELTHFDGYAMLDAIEFGAKWKEQQMMKRVVEAKVYNKAYPTEFKIETNTFMQKLKYGDNVKLIIIKED